MHARTVRTAALAAAVTGTLTWGPSAAAQSAEPTPTASTAPTETPAPDAGSVAITKKDPAGDRLVGAAFLLLDPTGQEAGRGKTDARGELTFPGLAPGMYRLKETSSGSLLHDTVSDQDIIVTPGATTHLAITDPFKAAQILLKAKNDKTGKLLPGATVNIGIGKKVLLTLTTGPKGTASSDLPVSSRTTEFWVKQIKAPKGYDLYKPSKTFTAVPGAPVTVTVTNLKTETSPKPDPSGKPTDQPTPAPSTPKDKPAADTSGGTPPTDSAALGTDSSPAPAAAATEEAAPKAPDGSLAHTGADATPWLLGSAGLLVIVGGAALAATRRQHTHDSEEN
ncbi:SpaA isopeptide-forming pilin-related protein [Streptomyces sp. NPDC059604]|uniref:SpaA isopeptide-forming pilin-related protein n=1 Tax=Streptomyces sp. NPDC059604 TaxID=3346881 RepID=UPI0036D03FEA